MIVCQLEGGLGNQLFMISNVFAYAKKHNLDYCVYTKVNNPHIYGNEGYDLSAYRFPGINYCDTLPDLPIFNEPHFHYAEIPKMDNVIFKGFWQSFKYFDFCRDEILKAFGFKWELRKKWTSIHYRAGDYRKFEQYHPVVSEEYINEAVFYFYTKGVRNYFVVSDEIETIKQFFSAKKYEYAGLTFEFSETNSAIEDLVMASCCQNNIGSNSTFSLWINYLNQNPEKIGAFPRRWFGPALNHDTKDLYPKNAIIL